MKRMVMVSLLHTGEPVHLMRTVKYPRRHHESLCSFQVRYMAWEYSRTARRSARNLKLICPECQRILSGQPNPPVERGLFDNA